LGLYSKLAKTGFHFIQGLV